MKLLGLGDNVMDAYLFRGELYPGGNAANVAVLAKRAPYCRRKMWTFHACAGA